MAQALDALPDTWPAVCNAEYFSLFIDYGYATENVLNLWQLSA